MIYKNVELHNVAEVLPVEDGKGVLLSRVPNALRLQLNEKAQKRALNGAGVELRFQLHGDEAVIVWKREAAEGIEPKGIAEVYQGSFQSHYEATPHIINSSVTKLVLKNNLKHQSFLREQYEAGQLSFDPSVFRVLLPQDCTVCLLGIEGDVSPPRRQQLPHNRFLAYGSSITFGGDAAVPSGGYAARTAATLGADLINLGFAGSCYLEEEMADYIAARNDWTFATLELGINVIGFMPPETFEQKVQYFMRSLTNHHPDKWVFCIDIITCHRDWSDEPIIHQFREIVRQKVEELNHPRLVYVSGRELLTDWRGLSIDLLHPSAEGMFEIARNLSARIQRYRCYSMKL